MGEEVGEREEKGEGVLGKESLEGVYIGRREKNDTMEKEGCGYRLENG
jgi:hypothetical protein